MVATEQCNGQGACRKLDGTMCPSFMATGDEEHSTRGRANLQSHVISAGPWKGRRAADMDPDPLVADLRYR